MQVEEQADDTATGMKKTFGNYSKASKSPPEIIPAGSESLDNTLFFVKAKDGTKGPFTIGQYFSIWETSQITAKVKPGF